MGELRNLIRSKIVSAVDIKEETIVIPEWDNVEIVIRGMNGKQRALLMNKAVDAKKGTVSFSSIYPDACVFCCYTVEGEQVFEPGDVEMLEGKSAAVIERIASKALEISGLTTQAEEEIEKN